MDVFICPYCGNSDSRYVGYRKGKPYCRKCISFRGHEVIGSPSYPKTASFKLSYDLSDEQRKLSDELLNNYKSGINSLVYAVCGAGKTEIVLSLIQYVIRCGEKVAFVIPRRDVVIEIADRFASIFKNNTVQAVYGGHTNVTEADLVVLTSHQLYRYNNYFDLIVMDEIDAFPYKNNDILEAFFSRALRGHFVMMSATPDEKTISKFSNKGYSILTLFNRFHGHPLPVPCVYKASNILILHKLIKLLKEYKSKNKPVFIFAPTINLCEEIFEILSIRFKGGNYVHSKRENREEIIEDFKNKKYWFLVTTAVLERGVTVKDLQVIIYQADHIVYDSYSLVQISGRVGRKKDAPDGDVYFLCRRITNEIQKSINDIETANKDLQNLF